jgi:hypothetical protein
LRSEGKQRALLRGVAELEFAGGFHSEPTVKTVGF